MTDPDVIPRALVIEHLRTYLGMYRHGDIAPDHLIKQIINNMEWLGRTPNA